jgi:hypothetical protein
MAVFWDVAPYSLIDIDQRFRGSYCLHHQGGGDGGSKLHSCTGHRPRRQPSLTKPVIGHDSEPVPPSQPLSLRYILKYHPVISF